MTIIAVNDFADLTDYERAKEGYEVPRPERCPEGCSSVMWRHGRYERGVVQQGLGLRVISVQRFQCSQPSCNKTVSVLFDFLVPYSRYTIQEIARHTEQYTREETTYEEMAWSADYTEGRPSKRSIWRWMDGLAKRAEKLLREIQREAVLSDVENALVEPVEGTCPNEYKAHTAKKAAGLTGSFMSLVMTERMLVRRLFAEDTIVIVLHRYFLTAAETAWSLFTMRSKCRLSTPQRAAYAIF